MNIDRMVFVSRLLACLLYHFCGPFEILPANYLGFLNGANVSMLSITNPTEHITGDVSKSHRSISGVDGGWALSAACTRYY